MLTEVGGSVQAAPPRVKAPPLDMNWMTSKTEPANAPQLFGRAHATDPKSSWARGWANNAISGFLENYVHRFDLRLVKYVGPSLNWEWVVCMWWEHTEFEYDATKEAEAPTWKWFLQMFGGVTLANSVRRRSVAGDYKNVLVMFARSFLGRCNPEQPQAAWQHFHYRPPTYTGLGRNVLVASICPCEFLFRQEWSASAERDLILWVSHLGQARRPTFDRLGIIGTKCNKFPRCSARPSSNLNLTISLVLAVQIYLANKWCANPNRMVESSAYIRTRKEMYANLFYVGGERGKFMRFLKHKHASNQSSTHLNYPKDITNSRDTTTTYYWCMHGPCLTSCFIKGYWGMENYLTLGKIHHCYICKSVLWSCFDSQASLLQRQLRLLSSTVIHVFRTNI